MRNKPSVPTNDFGITMGTWTSGNTEPRYDARRCTDDYPSITLPMLRKVVGPIDHLPLDEPPKVRPMGLQAPPRFIGGTIKSNGVRVMLWVIVGRRLKVSYNDGRDGTTTTAVQLDWTEAGFGGRRWWMQCPLCGENRTGLYLCLARLACRECQDLAYRSTRQTTRARNLDQTRQRQDRIRAQLVDGWDKPPRMRWVTYDRLIDELFDLRDAELEAMRAYAIPDDWKPAWMSKYDQGHS